MQPDTFNEEKKRKIKTNKQKLENLAGVLFHLCCFGMIIAKQCFDPDGTHTHAHAHTDHFYHWPFEILLLLLYIKQWID